MSAARAEGCMGLAPQSCWLHGACWDLKGPGIALGKQCCSTPGITKDLPRLGGTSGRVWPNVLLRAKPISNLNEAAEDFI